MYTIFAYNENDNLIVIQSIELNLPNALIAWMAALFFFRHKKAAEKCTAPLGVFKSFSFMNSNTRQLPLKPGHRI